MHRAFKRVIGNFGVSFFTPLAGGGVAETLFEHHHTINVLSFEHLLVIAAVTALFTTGLSAFKEIQEYGYQEKQ